MKRVLPFRPKGQKPTPSIFDVPGGLRLTASVTVERIPRDDRPSMKHDSEADTKAEV